MKIETGIFAGLVFFFLPVGVIYWWLTGGQEHVGYLALILCAAMGALITGYLWMTSRRIDERPEDNVDAEIADGAGPYGEFAPHSWWPLPLALSGAICFLGVAIGWWIFYIGLGLGAISLVGWVYEYYRGAHAH